MYNGRNGESLSRRDALEISVKCISLLDERTLATKLNIETVADLEKVVTKVAETFTHYILNGRAGNGSSGTLNYCGMCFKQFPEDKLYDINVQNGQILACRSCFNAFARDEKLDDVEVET